MNGGSAHTEIKPLNTYHDVDGNAAAGLRWKLLAEGCFRECSRSSEERAN